MLTKNKKRIAVLRGGPSSEHSFSLLSGKSVLENLDRSKYIPIDVYIDKHGNWHLDGVIESPYSILQFIDIVFNGLHGEYGENGELQRMLESLNILYTGSDSFASKMSMDKHTTKLLLSKSGILSPSSHVFRPNAKELDKKLAEVWKIYGHNSIVKPVSAGSSVGIQTPKDFNGLLLAVKKILSSGHSALVEEKIKGREVSVSVIQDFREKKEYTAIPTSIKYDSEYFDNQTKKSGRYHLDTMAQFSAVDRELVGRISRHIYKTLGLRHYARVDFIISERGVYFLEVNTLPGLTAHSILPFALKESGISIQDFLTHVIELAGNKKRPEA
jgi:D-alanine--D-alanine ligase